MNSVERKQARYERRKTKRIANRDKIIDSIGTAEKVLCYHDMFKYGEECCKGVKWKQSVQTFNRHLFSRTAANRKRALNNYKPKRLVKFTINERGKTRNIEAPHIDDRQIQKTLTKKVLLSLYQPRMIYDNGASLRGKGLVFSQKQLNIALRNHIKKYGENGYVIISDLKGFFPNADRNIVKARHREIKDEKLKTMLDTITDAGSGDKGLPLGVEPSQIEMIALPSPLDNYMTCNLGLQGFGHYMDDYHIFVPPDMDARLVLDLFVQKSKNLGIIVNLNKTQIIPIGKAFKFCKTKRIVESGKVITRGCPDSRKRAIRKIKMFAKMPIPYEEIYTSVNSIISYFKEHDNHGTYIKLCRLFYSSFGFAYNDLQEMRRRAKMQYICHRKFEGKTACGDFMTFKKGALFETVGNFIAYKEKALCTVSSENAYLHFARNDDGNGKERGKLTYAIAYSKRKPNKDNGFRFTDDEIEMLENEYSDWLRPNVDTIIFNYSFFNGEIERLRELAKRLEVA